MVPGSGDGWPGTGFGLRDYRMRWLFILLLLVNALYFGWQMRQQQVPSAGVEQFTGVSRIRMLGEVDQTLLLPRQVLAPDDGRRCYVLTGIETLSVAELQQQTLQELNIRSMIKPIDEERVLAYELVLRQPLGPEARHTMLTGLKQLGLAAEPAQMNQQAVYIVGRYATRTELNRARDRMLGLFNPDLYQVVSKRDLFELWLEADAFNESGNKINNLSDSLPRGIKIEKKLCKGVASTGERD